MNNAMKILILLVAVVGLTAVMVLWWFVQSNREAKQEEVLIEQVENQVIPEALEAVAEEEYAIEFEAEANEPVEAINMDLCDLVKSQCEEQGIEDCEDYEMCVEGVNAGE